MKKNLLIVALWTIAAIPLIAQDNSSNHATSTAFADDFNGATHVQSQQYQEISIVRFLISESTWIAFYSPGGALSGKAKRVSDTTALPSPFLRHWPDSASMNRQKEAKSPSDVAMSSFFRGAHDSVFPSRPNRILLPS